MQRGRFGTGRVNHGPSTVMTHHKAFIFGTATLHGGGCSVATILRLPRAYVVLCILHLMMSIGRLLTVRPKRVNHWSARDCNSSSLRGG